MKKIKFLLAIIIVPTLLFAQNPNPWPSKENIVLSGAVKNRMSLYAEVLDKYGKDKVITEFILYDTKAPGSVIDDEVHNEGEAFLFQPVKNGFTITRLRMPYNEKEKPPSTFDQRQIIMTRQKLKVIEKFISSAQIINYLKNFKKYQKMK